MKLIEVLQLAEKELNESYEKCLIFIGALFQSIHVINENLEFEIIDTEITVINKEFKQFTFRVGGNK